MSLSSRHIPHLITLLLFFAVMTGLVFRSETGLTPGIDEACYIQWALSGQPLDPAVQFLGLKLVPVLLIGKLVPALGPGMLSYYLIKFLFLVFTLIFLVSLYGWRIFDGDSEDKALLVTLMTASLPVVMNATGRLLSEMPAMAFFTSGVALATFLERGSHRRVAAASLFALSLAAFLVAYLCRTTIFTAIGAWCAYRMLDRALDSASRVGFFRRAVLNNYGFWLGAGFVALLVGWHSIFALPVFPLRYVAINLGDFQRPPQANRAAFFLAFGVHAPLLVLMTLLFWTRGLATRRHFAAWMWMLLTSAPFLYIAARNGEVLPRHVADLALPAAGLFAAMIVPSMNVERRSPLKTAIGAFAALVFMAAWSHAQMLTDEWVSYFSRHVLYANDLHDWLLLFLGTFIVFLTIIDCLHTRYSKLMIFGGLFPIMAGQIFLSFPAIRTDGCLVSPVYLRAMLSESGVLPGEPIALPVPHDEAAMLPYTLPQYNLVTIDYKGMRPYAERSHEEFRWAAVARHLQVDDPEILETITAMNDAPTTATSVMKKGQVTLYRLDESGSAR